MTKEVEARLKISAVDKTGSVLNTLGRRLDTLSKRMEKVSRSQQMIGKSFAFLSTVAGPAALAYGLKEAVVQFAEIERRMTRIGVTAGATREQTQSATDKVKELAMQTGLSFEAAVEGLDTLVSSGQSLEEALEFLPAVLKTAQATGSETADIANTALKAASALKISARQLDKAFDIMVVGGKAGQFELKDMASYIPGLANSFATLGYKGEEGLKMLIAILQTIREDTGSAEAAATQAGEVFGKIFAPATAAAFKKFGIDLNKEMKTAMDGGADAVTAFVEITKKAIDGDLKKLPQLFADKEFRAGMTSLLTSPEALQKFINILNSSKVEGTVLEDLNRVLGDTQSKIQNLETAWNGLLQNIGKNASDTLVPVIESLTEAMSETDAIKKADAMMGGDQQLKDSSEREFTRRVRAGGYIDPNSPQGPERSLRSAKIALGRGEIDNIMAWIDREKGRIQQQQYGQYRPGKGVPVLGGGAQKFHVEDANPYAPIVPNRPTPQEVKDAILMSRYADAGDYHGSARRGIANNQVVPASTKQLSENYQSQLDEFQRMEMAAFEAGGEHVKRGGDEAGRAMIEAGQQFVALVAQGGAALKAMLENIKVKVDGQNAAKANLGDTSTFAKNPMGPR